MRALSTKLDCDHHLESKLLPMAQLHDDAEKYRRRRLRFFPGWSSMSSSSKETKISCTELVCVVSAFIVLAFYVSNSSSSSSGFFSLVSDNSSEIQPSSSPSSLRASNFGALARKTAQFHPADSSTDSSRVSSSSQSSSSSTTTPPRKQKKNGPRIAAAITTSKRPELFRRAYLSFRLRCLDCDAMIDQWYAVDDGSSEQQLEAMHAVSSDITWLSKSKTKNETGHVSSLNRILTEVVDRYDYLVFLEDDFFFVQDEDYVAKALNIFAKNESIGQIVFNRRYSLTNTKVEDANQVGGIEVHDPESGVVTHILHEYIGPAGSPEWNAYFQKHPGIGSIHWPHFSLNSGIWKLKALKDVGTFEQRDAFEFFYGLRWMKQGYVTAFFPGKYSIHLGKPLPNSSIPPEVLDAMYKEQGLRHSVAGTASAYDLNGAIR